jgi:hypothetical protein
MRSKVSFGRATSCARLHLKKVERLEATAEDILGNRDDLEEIGIVGIDLTKRDTRHAN